MNHGAVQKLLERVGHFKKMVSVDSHFWGRISDSYRVEQNQKQRKTDDGKVWKGATFSDYFWLGGSEFEACLKFNDSEQKSLKFLLLFLEKRKY